ncbi:hypothetical protein GW793_00965 [bacterium]|uniref:Ribosomal RNA adenine methylase transferase N-terminal domain-containing protein n=2 Tax=Katanobacteria TaxID=422282 RepID=A0A2M7WZR2_UNCKA|nr:hypothetical protein [bacterium]PIP56856.1 MAG: hypothetical protein COX05_00975 [candidate division WWE3 bacterium CG22_combo_CG10-13_8_21_14_all_39_12]PJA39114.1 MAG: hypothetical protein CO179_05840 [candidate division WWE3 bacterium CG_4_9_14_3_um_filter_39_7]
MYTYSTYSNATKVKEIFGQLPIDPDKKKGQNFMINTTVVDRIMDVISSLVSKDTNVVEIGGGLGAFSVPLAHIANQYVVYEVDQFLQVLLAQQLKECPNARVELSNILDEKQLAFGSPETFVFGSLPYSITSPIFHKLIVEWSLQWQTGLFIIQKDVAEKITSVAPQSSYWNHFMGGFCMCKTLFTIPGSSFWPQPSVESSVLLCERRDLNISLDPKKWSVFLHKVHNTPRRQISAQFEVKDLDEALIDSEKRPQELESDQVYRLYKIVEGLSDQEPTNL